MSGPGKSALTKQIEAQRKRDAEERERQRNEPKQDKPPNPSKKETKHAPGHQSYCTDRHSGRR
ncbi:Uu.00g007710.m01.CDS01 [Anthostomella pinea]|uniref:Uu.00g007710.m01.CDS01 n=1 Tax=Anthostomella pinea TaxID=933095 RepID=A0AAI8VX09_9PEZI|nr:Uu.00g007710.m01.CDS01 [Anthostomella pinea]